jgi:hypothetical protein
MAGALETQMPKCRPGDLAVFVRATNTCNLGKIVRVLELCDHHEGNVWWWVYSKAGLKWIDLAGNVRWMQGRMQVVDYKLQPIRGNSPAVAQREKRLERVHCLTIMPHDNSERRLARDAQLQCLSSNDI